MVRQTFRGLRFVGIALLFGAVAVIPARSGLLQTGGDDGGSGVAETAGAGTTTGGETTGTATTTVTGTVTGATAGGSGLKCNRAGNGGATDIGVTASTINLASTVVQSGPGQSFLGASPHGMEAVVRKVNSTGGICGRLIRLNLRDDGWDAQRGKSALRAWIAEGTGKGRGYFAFPVVPSSEGLTAAIEGNDIDDAKIPVVGSDGMLRQQYHSPWVWPVATATVSTMRVMAKHGYHERGARCFGIVYDQQYRFGPEGAAAFEQYVNSLSGARVCSKAAIFPARASYSAEIQKFNGDCRKAGPNKCDFVAMLLEPQTALTWIAGRPEFGTKVTSGAQTLFNESFAANCGKPCNGMIVWTGYNPPIGNLAGLPDVKDYVNDVKTVSPTADTTNQFLEGAYLGMTVFVEALRRVGPNLTRGGLAQVMNSQEFRYDMASKLKWAQAKRNANSSAQAFSIVVAQGAFAGFRQQTQFIADPTPGKI